MSYRNAFDCKKCPKSNSEDGCPAWLELVMTNVQTGDTKIEKGCHFQLMPLLIIETIKCVNSSTETAANIKTEVARGYAAIANSIPGFVAQLAEGKE